MIDPDGRQPHAVSDFDRICGLPAFVRGHLAARRDIMKMSFLWFHGAAAQSGGILMANRKYKGMWRRLTAAVCLLAMLAWGWPLERPFLAQAAGSEITLPQALVGEAYQAQLMYGNLPGEPTLQILEGSALPEGLDLSYDGVLSGTPSQAGTYHLEVAISAGDLQIRNQYTLQVEPFLIVTQYLKPVTLGEPYTETIQVQGSGIVRYMLAEGTLPEGLSLDESTGELHGTVTAWNGDASFTIMVAQGEEQRTASYTLTSAGAPLQILGASTVTDQAASRPFSFRLGLQGGSGDYGYRITGDGIQGLDVALQDANLVISSAGSAAKSVSMKIEAWDKADPENKASQELSFSVLDVITVTGVNPAAQTTLGQPVSWQIQTKGGTGSKRYVLVQGTLPEGLQLSEESGIISGTPTAAGSFTIGIRVYDASLPGLDGYATINGWVADTLAIYPEQLASDQGETTLEIRGGVSPYSVEVLSADATVTGVRISQGSQPYQFVLDFDPSSTGTLTLQVKDAMGAAAQRTYVLQPEEELTLQVAQPPAATVNQTYDAQLSITVNTEEALTYTAQGLPSGLTMDASGRIQGTPASSGSFTVTILGTSQATGRTAQAQVTLLVAGSATIRQLIPVSGVEQAHWDAGAGQWLLELQPNAGEAVFDVELADPSAMITVPAPAQAAGTRITLPVESGSTAVITLTVQSGDGAVQKYTLVAARQTTSLQITGLPQEVKLGEKFTLTVEAQPEGSWLGPVTWEYDAGGLRHSGSNPATFETLKSGTFAITAQTRDALGRTITTNVSVRVVLDAPAPTATPKPTPKPSTVVTTTRRPATPSPEATATLAPSVSPSPAPTELADGLPAASPSVEPSPSPLPSPSPTAQPEEEKGGIPVWIWPLVAALAILVPSVIIVVVKDIRSRSQGAIIGDDIHYDGGTSEEEFPVKGQEDPHWDETDWETSADGETPWEDVPVEPDDAVPEEPTAAPDTSSDGQEETPIDAEESPFAPPRRRGRHSQDNSEDKL